MEKIMGIQKNNCDLAVSSLKLYTAIFLMLIQLFVKKDGS
jgi:hypothetical protein